MSPAAQDAAMRSIQAFHQDSRGWADIGYHFVVFPGGPGGPARILEGRHVTVVPAAQGGHNTATLAIALYSGGDDQVAAHTRYLVETIIQRFPSVRTVGTHRQVTPTSCPGDRVAAAVPIIARACGRKVYGDARGL